MDGDTIRIAVASDLHLEFEAAWLAELRELAARNGTPAPRRARQSLFDAPPTQRFPEAVQAWTRWQARHEDPGHPDTGPDLRQAKAWGADLLLLAGDIAVGVAGIAYAEAAARYLGCPVCTVLGNHEAYRQDLPTLLDAARAAARRTDGRVILLEQERAGFTLRGARVTVLGATLWTDYAAHGTDPATAMATAARGLTDHVLIRHGPDGAFTPAHARARHAAARRWLAGAAPAARADSDLTIVLTHHAPILEASAREHWGSALAPAFVSDLRAEIAAWAPDLWVWGHTHHGVARQSGGTRLVSAQRGYLGEEPGAPQFRPALVEARVGRRGASPWNPPGFRFAQLGRLALWEMQRLLREIDDADLVPALDGAPDAIRDLVHDAAAGRGPAASRAHEAAAAPRPDPDAVERARARLVATADRLAAAGVLDWQIDV